jgi:hypothetical protein
MNSEISDKTQDKQLFMWTIEHEEILIEWGDKAMCYRWLHSNANTLYSSRNTWYTIPVIIISTVTGTANFAQERIPLTYQPYFVMFIGAFNILAGIITTIQQFLKITQLNEAHRVAAIAWDKFYRNIKIELAKHPDERLNVTQMIKMSKEEYDRLIETCPSVPQNIVTNFKLQFENSPNFKEIKKPEICDELISTQTMRNKWYTEIKYDTASSGTIDEENHIKEQIIAFKDRFFKMNGRNPLTFEILDNLQETFEPGQISKLKKICDSLAETDETNQV